MESIIKADIFFFIASISLVLTSIVLLIFSYYGIKIFRSISRMCDIAQREVRQTTEDFHSLREHVSDTAHKINETIDTERKNIQENIRETRWETIIASFMLALDKIRREKGTRKKN